MTDTPDEPTAVGPGAEILSLAAMRERHEQDAVVLAAASGHNPELGQRTPQPTINRWTRAGNTDLTIGDVASILRAGEEGETRRLADLWLRMLKTDAHLASVWLSRINPVASSRWELSPGEGPESTAAAARRLRDACEEALRRLGNLEPVFTRQLGALGPGYSVAEIVWGRARLLGIPGWAPAKIKPVHARRFQFSDDFEVGLYDEGTAVSRLEVEGFDVTPIRGRGGVMARLPAGKYLVHQPPTIDDYPTATGLVHPIARWWWAKQVVTKYWLGGAELAANPRLIGRLAQLANKVAADDLAAGLESLAGDGVIMLRGESNVEIVPGQGTAATSVWETLAKFLDAAISKVVLGSTLNVEIGDTGGNRAAAESQGETTIDPRKEQDGAQLWATWQDQLFTFIRDFNPHLFPPDTPLPIGDFVFAEPPVEVDQPMIDSGWLKVDQLLVSRGLPPLGGEAGEAFLPRPVDDFGARPALPPVATPGLPDEPDAPEGIDAPEAAGAPVDVQETALNGAQVTALLEIVGQVVAGQLPRQTAIEVIVSAFPIDRAQADRILGDVGRTFTPTVPPETDSPVEDIEPAAEPPLAVPEVAASEAPFPMSALLAMARAKGRATLAGSAATQTSMPWLTTMPAKRPYE
jgi:hypothetical protein